MSLKALLERAAQLATLGSQLRTALNRLNSVPADAAADVDAFAAENPAYLRLVKRPEERTREIADIARALQETRTVAAGVVLFELSHAWPSLDQELRSFRQQATTPPGPVESFLRRSGGTRLHLSTPEELQIEILAELYRARFERELTHAQPSEVHDLYAAATNRDTDEAAAAVRFIEAKYGAGWSGPVPASDEERQVAVGLRRAIETTRAERVPLELDEASETVATAARLAGKTQHKDLYNLTPINLAQRPDLVDVWDAERPAVEAAALDLVAREQAEREAVEQAAAEAAREEAAS